MIKYLVDLLSLANVEKFVFNKQINRLFNSKEFLRKNGVNREGR